jgi:hypothetical protein
MWRADILLRILFRGRNMVSTNIEQLYKGTIVIQCAHDTRVSDLYDKIFQDIKPDIDRQYLEGANSQTYPSVDGSYVIKLIDNQKLDFEYDDMYGIIVMDRVESTDRKPTDRELSQIMNKLLEINVEHGDIQSQNILWDANLKRFQLIDFGSANCAYGEENIDPFVNSVRNEVFCQQQANEIRLSPAVRAFWFVKLQRTEYVVPPPNYTEDERDVLFALFNHFYNINIQRHEAIRFLKSEGRITYVTETGIRKKNIRTHTLLEAFEEDADWFFDAGIHISPIFYGEALTGLKIFYDEKYVVL